MRIAARYDSRAAMRDFLALAGSSTALGAVSPEPDPAPGELVPVLVEDTPQGFDCVAQFLHRRHCSRAGPSSGPAGTV